VIPYGYESFPKYEVLFILRPKPTCDALLTDFILYETDNGEQSSDNASLPSTEIATDQLCYENVLLNNEVKSSSVLLYFV